MNGWEITALVIGCWCTASVFAGIIVGHVLADRPLRPSRRKTAVPLHVDLPQRTKHFLDAGS